MVMHRHLRSRPSWSRRCSLGLAGPRRRRHGRGARPGPRAARPRRRPGAAVAAPRRGAAADAPPTGARPARPAPRGLRRGRPAGRGRRPDRARPRRTATTSRSSTASPRPARRRAGRPDADPPAPRPSPRPTPRRPRPRPSPRPRPPRPEPSSRRPSRSGPDARSARSRRRADGPAALAPAPDADPAPRRPASPTPRSPAADAAFEAKRYDEAGPALRGPRPREAAPRRPARPLGLLPLGRGRPPDQRPAERPPQEWAEIDAEIQQIRALSPNNWYGEYLRNRAAERLGRAGEPSPARPGRGPGLGPRGAAAADPAPADPPGPGRRRRPSRRPGRAEPARRGRRAAADAGRQLAGPRDGQLPDPPRRPRPGRAGRPGGRGGPRRADPSAGPASAPRGAWSPQCEIYLYPTAKRLQPDDRPARGIARLLDDGDERRPDHRPAGQPPGRPPEPARRRSCPTRSPTSSWPTSSRTSRSPAGPTRGWPSSPSPPPSSTSAPPTSTSRSRPDRLFQLDDLMAMDYPDGQYWGLYYAQSVSLTRFLVEQGTPAQFVEFVQGAAARTGSRPSCGGSTDRRLRRPPDAAGSPTPGASRAGRPRPPSPTASDEPSADD